MSDLHERLLAELAGFDVSDPPDRALRAVVERHKPRPCTWQGCTSPTTHRVCEACGGANTYPCTDIENIARELGVGG